MEVGNATKEVWLTMIEVCLRMNEVRRRTIEGWKRSF